MDYANRILVEELGYHAVPTYTPDQFEKMIEDTKPDTVIVTSVDRTHHRYIIKAMEMPCFLTTYSVSPNMINSSAQLHTWTAQ